MLVKCSECELQVSDKALNCPHCGNPMRSDAPVKKRKNTKRKRLPNGFGQISEIKGKGLRKPFRALITVGKDSKGRPICKPLKPDSYFATYNDAYTALVEYNKNPYDLSPAITVSELYEKWLAQYRTTYDNDSSIRTITSAWAYCSSIYKMRAMDVRARHLKGCMEEGYRVENDKQIYPSAGTKARMKSMFNLMFDYGLEFEIVERNYARTFTVSNDIVEEQEKAHRGHIPFSEAEMTKIKENVSSVRWADLLLYQCYSGWRPQELGLIRMENVDLENWTITGGMKTDAGENRLVPIHPFIRDIILKYYEEAKAIGSEYLFNCTDRTKYKNDHKLTYSKLDSRFSKVVERLGLNPEHKSHDGRMHFVTMAKKAKVDDYAIKYIVGHRINDVTEKVYTKREVDWLHEEIRKIP